MKRLLDMGVEPDVLSATLPGIVGQPLVRSLCAFCKEPYTPSREDARSLLGRWHEAAAAGGYEVPRDAPLYRGRGCEKCRNTGYKGRTGLFEVLVVNTAFTDVLLGGACMEELSAIAIGSGMRTLVAHGWRKVVDGTTTPQEVRRVTAAVLL